jgi:pimeloyl-ACP methyl ester carboxylesterase
MRGLPGTAALIITTALTLSAAQGQEVQMLEVSDGAQIAYRVEGQGPPILFLHGFLGNMDYWAPLTDSLRDEFTIVRMDLRGHGRSTNPRPEYDHAQFARDAVAVMSTVGFERFAVVGHSSGGITAYNLSSLFPDRVRWQVVIGSVPRLPPDHRARLANWPQFEDMEDWIQEVMLSTQPRGREQIEHLLRGFREFGGDRPDIDFGPEKLARMTTPTLVIWGDREEYAVETAVQLYRDLPNAMLWVVPDVGHQVFWPDIGGSSLAAEQFADAIRWFAVKH